MKKHYQWLIIPALLCSSGTILVDRFVTAIPLWLTLLLAAVAVGSLAGYAICFFRERRQENQKTS